MLAFNLNKSLYVPNANLFKSLCIHTCLLMALGGLALGAGFIYQWLHILLPAGICGKITSQPKGKCRSSLCFTPWCDSHFLNWISLTFLTAPRHLQVAHGGNLFHDRTTSSLMPLHFTPLSLFALLVSPWS